MDLGVLEIGVWVVRAPGVVCFVLVWVLRELRFQGGGLGGGLGLGFWGFEEFGTRPFADLLPVLRHGVHFAGPAARARTAFFVVEKAAVGVGGLHFPNGEISGFPR